MRSDETGGLPVDALGGGGHDEGEGEGDVGKVAGGEGKDEEVLEAVGVVGGVGVGEGEDEGVHEDVVA